MLSGCKEPKKTGAREPFGGRMIPSAFVLCAGWSKAEKLLGSYHQTQREYGDHDFADSAYRERAEALLAHVSEVCAQADACERQKKCPARKIGERADLVLAEKLVGGQHRDEQEAEDELGKLLPEKGCLVADRFCLALAGPVDGVGEHDEADHGVSRGLYEDGEFPGGVGVESACSGGFGGVVHREACPYAVGAVTQVEEMADQRESEECESA